jgi:2-amino-4-hydroxy-6-hydroxymethyldihydropteridine diphosphokinase
VTSVPNPFVIDADTLTGELRPIRRVALGLGSNLGDRLEYLQAAVDTLTETPDIVPVAVSSVYETEPVGGPPGQPAFLNAVLVVDTMLSARTLIERALAVEDAYGRARLERWGPRTLDIDLLAVGAEVIDEPGLTVPHPLVAERAFVLAPWAEVDPDFDLPGHGRVADLAARAGSAGVRRTDLYLLLPG